jgi:hypothetical protein
MKLDPDFVLRHDVGHAHAEDVGPLLLEQRRALPLLLGLVELLLRPLLLADLRPDAVLADLQRHAVHRGPGRGRKHVLRIQGMGALVAVDLRDHHVRDDARDAHVGLRFLERQPVDLGIAVLDEEVRRQSFVRVRPVCGAGACKHERHPENQGDCLPRPFHCFPPGQAECLATG